MSAPLVDGEPGGLSLPPQSVLRELQSMGGMLQHWSDLMVAGLPGLQAPGTTDQLLGHLKALRGELLLLSAKAEALANIIAEDLQGV